MIGYVERGLRIPSIDIILHIMDALNLDLAKVLGKARKRCSRISSLRRLTR
jgi:transcriptional regulator with XRE-family HTH domain